MTRLLATAVISLILLTPGCITTYGDQTVSARVFVTEDMGTQIIQEANVTLPENASVLDALRETATVETRYGGGFVNAIDGQESRFPDHKMDWFYHVNTRLATTGAASNTVDPHDVIVWDYRPWNHTTTLPHLLTGLDTWPSNLTTNLTPTPQAWNQTANDPAQQDHLFARITDDTLTLLDSHHRATTTLQPPWLLVHAAQSNDETPRMLVRSSGPQALPLADQLADQDPTGLGLAITPNATYEVPS